jgi:hypothetical protein
VNGDTSLIGVGAASQAQGDGTQIPVDGPLVEVFTYAPPPGSRCYAESFAAWPALLDAAARIAQVQRHANTLQTGRLGERRTAVNPERPSGSWRPGVISARETRGDLRWRLALAVEPVGV